MANLTTLTNDNLRALIDETESTLKELRAELERREELAQEREIANLENHMKSAELSLKSIRDFIAYLLDDIRSEKR
ncbi:MAG: hypothetical protein R3F54_32160 [Alphaproteobacteria bacterium]